MNSKSSRDLTEWHPCFAFNIWDITSAKAVIDAAKEKDSPIFLQISSKVFNEINPEEFIYVIKDYINKTNTNVLVHLDHSSDIDQIQKAIEIGWDSVMYDGSHLSIDDNINNTNKVLNIAQKYNVLVEAEIGQVKGVEDDKYIDQESIVFLEDVQYFVSHTNVDMLAVAIGTAHGQYGKNMPNIDYILLNQIEKIINIPFVVHGGSELSNETLKKLFSHKNVKKINISTDLKQAYRLGIVNSSQIGLLDEKGFNPIRIEKQIYESIKQVAISKLEVLKEI